MAKLISLAALLGFVVAVQCASVHIVKHRSRFACDQSDEYWISGEVSHYTYTTTVFGASSSATDGSTGTKISCNVALQAAERCHYALEVHGCELLVADSGKNFVKHAKSDEFKEEMAKHPITFKMSHGQVSEVIVNELEPVSITNIKRGIITNLQGCRRAKDNSYDDTITDVQGTCPVHFTKDGNKIHQVKDVNHCSFPSRPDWDYTPTSLIWNLGFMQYGLNAESECEHEISEQGLQKSTCHERHSLRRDERTKKAHAETTVTGVLELTKVEKVKEATQMGRQIRLTGIQYEWETRSEPTNEGESFFASANAVVNDLVATTLEGVQPDTGEKLDELVRLFRKNSNVLDFTKKVAENSRATKLENEIALSFVRDALVTCNREQCIAAIAYLATNNHLSDNYLTVLLYTLTKTNVNKPSYLTAVCDICKVKPSRTCLLSLTSMIHTYVKNHPEEAKANPPKAIQITVDYLYELLGQKDTERIILALKSIGNLGDIAIDAEPNILERVRSFVDDTERPHNVSLSAIKALRRVSSHNREVYSTLIKIVRDPHQHMEHKIVAYLVLTHNFHPKLYIDLARIIDNEPTDQLGNFVTMHMNNVLTYGDESLELLKKSIMKAFVLHSRTFTLQGERPYTTSRHRENVRSRKSPFLPDFASRFGYDIQKSAIYEAFSFLPQHLIVNLTTQLFGKKFNSLTMSAALHGLDPYLEYFFHFKTGGKVESLVDRIKALQEHTDLSAVLRTSNWVPHFDSDIEQKLTQIHDSVIHDYGKEPFAASFSLARFGDELAYTSWGIIKAKLYSFVENDFQNINWDEHKEYRAHRFIRFLEGSHQIPLVVGLPLKWKTTADLVSSFRIEGSANPFGLLSEPKFFKANWGIHPSGVITMVNKMSVKVPKFTKNGIKVVTTFYRSRDEAGSFQSIMGNIALTVETSPRRQHLFNLIRKTYYIRDGQREDIGDGKLLRTEKEDCHSCEVTGLRVCRHKSFAEVADRRMIDVFTNNLEYQVYFELADKDLKAYILNVEKESTEDGTDMYKFHFEAPGEKWKREINGRYSRNPEKKEFSLQLEVPEVPHFKLKATRKQTMSGKVATGHTTDVEAEIFEGRPVTLHGQTTLKSGANKETNVQLKFKDRTYKLRRTFVKSANKIEIDDYIDYESSNPKSLMHQILPGIAFKDAKHASGHIHVDVTQHPGDDDDFERAINAFIKVPKAIFELNTERFSSKDKRALHFKVTRRSQPSNVVESFLHLTYDFAGSKVEDEVLRNHEVRFAIPSVRWTGQFNRKTNPVDTKIYAGIKREKAADSTLEVTDSTPVESKEVSLRINHHNDSAARGDVFPAARERTLNAVLTYPADGTEHTFTLDVNYMNDEGVRDAVTSFKTDGTAVDTLNQLKAHGVTDYIRTDKGLSLDYNMDVTNLATGNKANYNVDLKVKRDFSTPATLKQTYKSSRYTFKEVASLARTETNGYKLDLEIDSDCPTWDFLTYALKQQVYLHREELGWEKTEFRHKYIDIDVKAEYKLPFTKYSKKEIKLTSKTPLIPSITTNILLENDNYGHVYVVYPDEKRNVYAVAEMDDSATKIVAFVDHEKEGSERKRVIDYSLRLLRPDTIERNYTVDRREILKSAARRIQRLEKLVEAWNRIKEDPDHPMNKYLQPIVKTTVGDYIRECQRKRKENHAAIRAAFENALESLRPIYEPTLELIGNIIKYTLENYLQPLLEAAKKYLEREDVQRRIRHYINDAVERMKARIHGELVKKSYSGSETFKLPFEWERFDKVPLWKPELVRFVHAVRTNYYHNEFPSTRYAVLYGNHNVHTFDGYTYKIQNLPNPKCTYLLAHNFVARRFSLFGGDGNLHLLLPNVAVAFYKNGDVTLNKEKVTLPVDTDDVDVCEDDGVIKVTTPYGIGLELNPKRGMVLVGMSFWNHNKTLGLLGNNDNERKNDLRLLNGHLAGDAAELLAGYELRGDAECSNVDTLRKRKECDKPTSRTCHAYLNKYRILSPYFMCYDVVDPRPFERSCENDSHCGVDPCGSILAYVALCEKHNIHLQLPETCLH